MSRLADVARSGRSVTRRAARRHEFTWRYVLNLLPTVSYAIAKPRLAGECLRILEELNRHGIAITSIERLFGGPEMFDQICDAVQALMHTLEPNIEQARTAAKQGVRSGQKPFLLALLGHRPCLDATSAYGRLALAPQVSAIAQAYFGMQVVLRHYNVWCNFVTRGPASQSQLWHRDPEDRYILKIFVCMNDLDEGNGPFTYAPGTHPKGAMTRDPEFSHKDGRTNRSNDEQVGKIVPPHMWVRGMGPAGTMIFADTRGLHKGGLTRERERLLYTAEFTSPAAGDGGIRTGRI